MLHYVFIKRKEVRKLHFFHLIWLYYLPFLTADRAQLSLAQVPQFLSGPLFGTKLVSRELRITVVEHPNTLCRIAWVREGLKRITKKCNVLNEWPLLMHLMCLLCDLHMVRNIPHFWNRLSTHANFWGLLQFHFSLEDFKVFTC